MIAVTALLALFVVAPQDDLSTLIRKLASDDPETRAAAQEAIVERGGPALPELRAARLNAGPEKRGRLSEIIREIELRLEGQALERAGIPARLVRIVPGFKKRLFEGTEDEVIELLKDLFGYREELQDEEDRWRFGRPRVTDLEAGKAVLGYVLRRARTRKLKLVGISIVPSYRAHVPKDALLRLASDPDRGVRLAVLNLAGNIPLPGAEVAFAEFLRSGTEDEKLSALRALREMETPRARRLARPALRDASIRVKTQAIDVLMWGEDMESVPSIRALLKDPDDGVRYKAVWALQNMRARDALGDVLALKDDPDEQVRYAVIHLIGHWREPRGKDVVLQALSRPADVRPFRQSIVVAGLLDLEEACPRLLEVLAGSNGKDGDAAAQALSAIGSARHEAALLKLVRTAKADVGRRAVTALKGRSTPAVIEALASAVKRPELRKEAVWALAACRGRGVEDALREALKEESLKSAVLAALERSPLPASGRLALPFLTDSDPSVARKAMTLVQRRNVREAIPVLTLLLTHEDPDVAASAASAYYRLDGAAALGGLRGKFDRLAPEVRRRVWNYMALNADDDAAALAIERFDRDTTQDARRYVLDVLCRHKSEETTTFLSKLLERKDRIVSDRAAHELARRREARGLEAVRAMLKRDDPASQRAAAATLAECGELTDAIASLLFEGAMTSESYARRRFLRPLAEARRPEARNVLLDQLSARYWFTRDEAARWMAAYPEGTFDGAIRKRASDGNPTVRRGAARALSHVVVKGRAEILAGLVADPSEEVRSEAVGAYRYFTPETLPPELSARLRDESGTVRKWAVDVLGKLDPAAVQERLTDLLSDPNAEVREEAVSAAGASKLKIPAGGLEKLLADPNNAVRGRAAWAAGALGRSDLADRIHELFLNETNSWIRSRASGALLALKDERGLGAVREMVSCGVPVLEGWALIRLMRIRDLESFPRALHFIRKSSATFSEANRTLLAMNAFTQPELYRKARETRVRLPVGDGRAGPRMKLMGEALGVPFDVAARIPDRPRGDLRYRLYERTLEDEMNVMGYYLRAACILESDGVRVVTRKDAVAHWAAWYAKQKR